MTTTDILFLAPSDHIECKRNIFGIGNFYIICDGMLEGWKMTDSTSDDEELINDDDAEFSKLQKLLMNWWKKEEHSNG